MIIRKMNKNNTNLKDKDIYFLRMNFSDAQKQAIVEYGEAKYHLGYKEGYISGMICGILLGSITLMVVKIVKIT